MIEPQRRKKEKTFSSMLKSLSIKPEPIIEKIKASYDIPDFLDEARENPNLLESYIPKSKSQELSKILEEKTLLRKGQPGFKNRWEWNVIREMCVRIPGRRCVYRSHRIQESFPGEVWLFLHLHPRRDLLSHKSLLNRL